MISQKSFDIADFFDFEETFRNECSERNERRGAESGAEVGVPFGVTVVTRTEWSDKMNGENVSKNLKTSVILDSIFVTITPKKKRQRPWSNMRCKFSPFQWDPLI